jgi:hypothetical protein
MAITAQFFADFTSFSTAVDKAVLELKSFETNVTKVDKTLNKFGDQFSGRKLIQDALLMEKAIDELGGVTKLTGDEMKRAGDLAAAAVDKMKKMGIEVPPQLEKLSASIKDVETKLTLSERAAGFAKSTFGSMFSAFTAASLVDKAVGSLVEFGKAAFDSAGQIQDLSEKTGLSTTAIQQMQEVAKLTGSDLETFTGSAQKLGVNLAKGTDDAKNAMADLGLSFDAIRKLKPEDQFIAVIDALGKVEDQGERTRLAQELMGKGMADVSVEALRHYRELANGATVASSEQIKAIADLGDAWDKFKDDIQTSLLKAFGSMSTFADNTLAWADRTGNKVRGALGLDALSPAKSILLEDFPGKKAPAPAAPTAPDQTAAERAAAAAEAKRKEAEALKAANAERQKEIDLVKQLQGLDTVEAVENEIKALNKFGKGIGPADDELKKFYADAEAAARTLDRMGESARADKIRAYADAMKIATTDTRGFGQMLAQAIPGLTAAQSALANMATPLQPLAAGTDAFRKQLDLAIPGLTTFEAKAKQLQQTGDDPGFLGGMTKGLDNFMQGMTGGKGVGGFLNKLGGDVVQGFGNILSGGLSSAISAGIGLVTKGVGKLWGSLTGAEGKKTNDVRDEFIKANYGTEDALRKLAFQAGATDAQVRKIFSTKTVESFQAAIGEVQGLMGTFTADQTADAARLDAAIEKYGFTFEEIGAKLQKSKLDEQSKDLIEDWRVLLDAGVDVTKVNEKMADTVNKFVQQAKRTGTEVPAAMKPMLQSMVDQGRLTDESGKKIDKLEDIGITFSDTMTQGFDKVVKKLDELISRLGGVGKAIDDMPDSVDVAVNFVPGEGASPTPQPDLPDKGVNAFHALRGTGGQYLDFGRATQAVLHGHEKIVTAREGAAEAAGMADMVAAIGSLQTTLLRAMRDNALQVRDQVQLARA